MNARFRVLRHSATAAANCGAGFPACSRTAVRILPVKTTPQHGLRTISGQESLHHKLGGLPAENPALPRYSGFQSCKRSMRVPRLPMGQPCVVKPRDPQGLFQRPLASEFIFAPAEIPNSRTVASWATVAHLACMTANRCNCPHARPLLPRFPMV